MTPPARQLPGQQAEPRLYTEEEVIERIEHTRREEKDKLYGKRGEDTTRLQQLEAELDHFRQTEAERQAAEAAEAERIREAEEEELPIRDLIKKKDQEWGQRLADFEAERETERAVFAKERRFNELQKYRSDRMLVEAENIHPALLDLVRGESEEEIEASIASLRERSDAIVAEVHAIDQQQRAQMPGVSVTAPAVEPTDTQPTTGSITADDIKAMSFDDYAKYRATLLPALSQQVREKGLYG